MKISHGVVERTITAAAFTIASAINCYYYDASKQFISFLLLSVIISISVPLLGGLSSAMIAGSRWFRKRSLEYRYVDGQWLMTTDVTGADPTKQKEAELLAPGIWEVREKNDAGELDPVIHRLEAGEQRIGYTYSKSLISYVSPSGRYVNHAEIISGGSTKHLIAFGTFSRSMGEQCPDHYRGKVIVLDDDYLWDQAAHKITTQEVGDAKGRAGDRWKEHYIKRFLEGSIALRF